MARKPFNHDEPIGSMITWTTYGTWLPGDERGWNRKFSEGPEQPNELTLDSARESMKESAFTLNPTQRKVVEETILRHCQIRGWEQHAISVRSNHVHVVVSTPGYEPKTVRDQFKAWTTRNLKTITPGRTRFWTEGASIRYLNNDDELDSAVVYVVEAQDRKGVEKNQ